jgi:GAF domain-containing protein
MTGDGLASQLATKFSRQRIQDLVEPVKPRRPASTVLPDRWTEPPRWLPGPDSIRITSCAGVPIHFRA